MIPLESLGKEYWITDVRPLAKAARRFEDELRTAVTYEDPVNLFEGDVEPVVDKATPTSLAADPAFREEVSTKRRTLNFFLTAATPDQQQWIQKAVEAYNRGEDPYNRGADPPARFEVRTMSERLHIVPVEVKTTTGKYEPYRSPLDYPITVEPRHRSCAEFLRELYAAVNQASGVAMESRGPGPPSNCRTALGGHDVLARKLLLDFVAAQRPRLDLGSRIYGSWQLLRHPTIPPVLCLSLDAFRSLPVPRLRSRRTSLPVLLSPFGSPVEMLAPPSQEAPGLSSQCNPRPSSAP